MAMPYNHQSQPKLLQPKPPPLLQPQNTTPFSNATTPLSNAQPFQSLNAPIPEPQDSPPEINKTTLIVNYLPQSLTDETFRMIFEAVGPLKSSKICRQKTTGWSYGFGFIEYHMAEHAQQAIDNLNGYQIDNKRLKVALSRPGGDQVKGANLYIRNIPRLITQEELQHTFAPYGNIINCRVLTDKNTGASRGCGFVLYEKKQQAQAAIMAMTGAFLKGSDSGLIIRVADDNSNKVRPPSFAGGNMQDMGGPGPIRPPQMRQYQGRRFNPMAGGPILQAPKSIPGMGVTLHVYNVGTDAVQDDVAALFTPFGHVVKVDLMWDYARQQCKGYCFVTMANQEEAQAAIDNLNGYMYTKRPLQVSFYNKKT